jgi:peroxiredoxin Q/BCP
VSLDDVATQKRFHDKHELSFPLLSDTDASAATRYHALAGLGTYAKRVTFVIDPKGVIRHVDRSIDVSTHGSDLVKVVKDLQAK